MDNIRYQRQLISLVHGANVVWLYVRGCIVDCHEGDEVKWDWAIANSG